MPRKYFSQDKKLVATRLLKEGKTDAEIAKEIDFPVEYVTEWRKRTGMPEGDKAPVKPVEDKNGPVVTKRIPKVEKPKKLDCCAPQGASGGPGPDEIHYYDVAKETPEHSVEDLFRETPERPAPPPVRQLALAKALELVQSPPDFIEALIAYLQVYVDKEMGGQ